MTARRLAQTNRLGAFVVDPDTRHLVSTGSATDCCVECAGAFVDGDVVVVFFQGPRVLVQPNLYVHRYHFDELLAAAPADRRSVDAEIAALLDQVERTGMSPVEEVLGR